MDDQSKMAEATTLDAEVRELVESGEAGIGDLMTVYERIEERYIAAAAASAPDPYSVGYATHT